MSCSSTVSIIAQGRYSYKLKPTTKTISLRMPESMLNEMKMLANKRDVPYQSLIKMFLRERSDSELYKKIS